ncbi:MAG TPA: ATP-binding protein [Ktedonobacteraceae bacterium]|nr:ATP-binding protein [Ktedonobacteraceae bacterium]
MKISVRNLGVIREEANIDLKPLTVFIGPNNSGKTWLAYALAGIFGDYGSGKYAQAYAQSKVPNSYELLNAAIEGVLTQGNATIDLRRFADEYGESYFNNVAQYAPNWMHSFLSTQLAHFDDMNILLNLAETKEDFLTKVSQYSRSNLVAGSVLTIRKSSDDDRVFAFTSTEVQDGESQEEQLGEKIPVEDVRESLVSYVATALRRSLYPQVRVFPTERTTFVATRFSERIADSTTLELSQEAIDALGTLTRELDIRKLVNIATREAIWPVSSFLTMLRSIFRISSRNRELREKTAKRDPTIRRYIELAEILERQILAGNVSLSTPEPDPRREVLFQPTEDVDLEIPIVSSMVKELSPLVLYLRYLAQPGELVIIDEPEMNLHPAAQVKIIEFLAMLVNAGLHVLITTHSTYVIDHLTNLLDAYRHQNQDDIVEMFLLEDKEAFITQEKVSVYSFENGEVKNILKPEGVIDWRTFSDVTTLVERIHFELSGE